MLFPDGIDFGWNASFYQTYKCAKQKIHELSSNYLLFWANSAKLESEILMTTQDMLRNVISGRNLSGGAPVLSK